MQNSFTRDIAAATRAGVQEARGKITEITGKGKEGDEGYVKGKDMTDPLNGFMLQEAGAALNAALGAGSAILGKNEKGNEQVLQRLG